MSAVLIDGKRVASEVRADVAREVAALKEGGVKPSLAVILAGEDPASKVYVRNKRRACKECGILSRVVTLPEDVTQEALEAEIDALNADASVHGILVQLPLPKGLDAERALGRVRFEKDVDGFHLVNAGALLNGEKGHAAAGTPRGCMALLKDAGVKLDGARAVVVGRSNIVGKPLALMLLGENCTVTVCHSHTRDLAAITREADVLVAAIGRPRFITADMIKPGAAVIDVGVNRLEDGSLCGDVDFEAAKEVAGWITPVPGGVGPMTIAMLMRSTVEAARRYGR